MGRFKCGHWEEVRGLSEAEVTYMKDVMACFNCFRCVADEILRSFRARISQPTGGR